MALSSGRAYLMMKLVRIKDDKLNQTAANYDTIFFFKTLQYKNVGVSIIVCRYYNFLVLFHVNTKFFQYFGTFFILNYFSILLFSSFQSIIFLYILSYNFQHYQIIYNFLFLFKLIRVRAPDKLFIFILYIIFVLKI